MKPGSFLPYLAALICLSFASAGLQAQATSFYPGDSFLKKAGAFESREGIRFISSVFPFRGEGDSLNLVVATQVENQALQFVKDGDAMKAALDISVYMRNEEQGFVLSRTWQESLTVQRESEVRTQVKSVFQTVHHVPAGKLAFSNEVTDRNADRTGIIGPSSIILSPVRAGYSAFGPYPFYASPSEKEKGFYHSESRSRLDDILLNPGKSYGYGLEDVGFYMEIYRPDTDQVEPLRVKPSVKFGEGKKKDLEETTLTSPGLTSLSIYMKPGMLGLGEGVFKVDVVNREGAIVSSDSTFFFVTLTEEWMLTEYEGAINYLKYILTPKEIDRFEKAPKEERRELWKSFWKERDPIPSTPQNERLVEYFRMIQVANARYTSPLMEGWKSDRGRVLIMLGPPDEAYLREEGRNFERYEIWQYSHSLGFQLTLYFKDKGYTGLYWLTNEGDLQQALARLRNR